LVRRKSDDNQSGILVLVVQFFKFFKLGRETALGCGIYNQYRFFPELGHGNGISARVIEGQVIKVHEFLLEPYIPF
jgi:hypothetical protein